MLPTVIFRRHLHTLGASLALLCCSGPGLADAPAAPASVAAGASDSKKLPTGPEVVGRYVEAIGGEEALRARTSLSIKGVTDNRVQARTQNFEVHKAPPNKMVMKIDLLERKRSGGSDGEIIWALDEFTGPQILPPPTVDTAPNYDFFRDLNYPKHYRIFETVSRERFEGRECYKLRLVSATGKETFEFFDVETGLKAGVMTVHPGRGKPPITQIDVWSDWREDLPIKHHTTVTEKRNGEIAQVFTYETIEWDALPMEFFDLPAEVQAHLADMENREQQGDQPQEAPGAAPGN